MTAEAVVAEPPAITGDDQQESEDRLRHEIRESEDRLRHEIRDSEGRIHRELQHYATKADLKDTELRLGSEISGLRTDLKDTELRLKTEISNVELRLRTGISDVELRLQTQIKDAQMWLLLRLGGLIFAAVTIAVAVLKLLEGLG